MQKCLITKAAFRGWRSLTSSGYVKVHISSRQLSGGVIVAVAIFPFTDTSTPLFCLWSNSHQLQAKSEWIVLTVLVDFRWICLPAELLALITLSWWMAARSQGKQSWFQTMAVDSLKSRECQKFPRTKMSGRWNVLGDFLPFF